MRIEHAPSGRRLLECDGVLFVEGSSISTPAGPCETGVVFVTPLFEGAVLPSFFPLVKMGPLD